jgi:hypothetical protein
MFMGCGCHCIKEESIPSFESSRRSVIGSSQSVGSSRADVPDIYEASGCDFCTDKVAAVAYDIFWDYRGVKGADRLYKFNECCQDYNTSKTMRVRRVAIPNPPQTVFGEKECRFISDLPAKFAYMDFRTNPFFPTKGCGTVTLSSGVTVPRVVMRIAPLDSLGGIISRPIVQIFYGTKIYGFGAPAGAPASDAANHWVTYTYVPPNGEDWRLVGTRCLRAMTFRFGASATAPILPRDYVWENSALFRNTGEPYGAPCEISRFGFIDTGLPEFITVTPVPA